MAKDKARRRAELDAIKIVAEMARDAKSPYEAAKIVVPLVHSKPTKYTTNRRKRAAAIATHVLKEHDRGGRVEALKAITAEFGTIKPKRKGETAYQKNLRKLSDIKQKTGQKRKLTAEERQAIRDGYTPKQVANRKTPDTRQWNDRLKSLLTKYEIPDNHKINDRDLEYLTAAAYAKKYELKTKPGLPGSEWRKFTETGLEVAPIGYYKLLAAAKHISSAEYEEPGREGHSEGWAMYDNNLYDDSYDWTLLDVTAPGHVVAEGGKYVRFSLKLSGAELSQRMDNVNELRNKICSDVFGDAYIFVPDGSSGRVLLRSEYNNAQELASDWTTSLLYKSREDI